MVNYIALLPFKCIMKKYLWIALLASTLFPQSMAGQKQNNMVVYFKNQTCLTISIDDHPQIYFEGEYIRIDTHSYSFSEVVKYTFGEKPSTDILSLPDDEQVTILEDGNVIVSAEAKGAVRVFTIDGKEVNVSQHEGQDGITLIHMNELAPAVYLMQIGEKTIKILKK